MDANEVHAQLGGDGWRQVLTSLGIAENFLANKHGPCPACGGRDRFRFDNRKGRGDYFCNHCGAGDGFKLVMRVFGLKFNEAKQRVMAAVGITERLVAPAVETQPQGPAMPTARVYAVLRESCKVEDCEPARIYLASRCLWPLPLGHTLRAHPSVPYWRDGECLGRYPALVAAVRDIGNELVTVHVTYLDAQGHKLTGFEPRKIFSGMAGRESCAVPLVTPAETMGIAEGIETAFSAMRIHRVPTWSALNSTLLGKFTPPSVVRRLVIFADHDFAGADAANKLMQRLQGRVALEVRTPPEKDWNDALIAEVA